MNWIYWAAYIAWAIACFLWVRIARRERKARLNVEAGKSFLLDRMAQLESAAAAIARPTPRLALIKALVHGTAGLELAKHEHRTLPQLPGGWGAFELRGNTLPEVTYRVFDEPSMEFVTVRASAAYHEGNSTPPEQPETFKVVFVSTITPDVNKPNETHEIAHQEVFEAPYWALLEHLYRYFPLLPVGKEPARVIA